MKDRITILEYANGFIMPLKASIPTQGNGAMIRSEIGHMIPKDKHDTIEIVIVKLDRTMSLVDFLKDE